MRMTILKKLLRNFVSSIILIKIYRTLFACILKNQ